jgi:hypothetical protein
MEAGSRSLGDASLLFDHWVDKTGAERTNYWLSVLQQNHQLLTEISEVSRRTSETSL